MENNKTFTEIDLVNSVLERKCNKEDDFFWIEYIKDLVTEENIYFTIHASEHEAKRNCASYNCINGNQQFHTYVGIRQELILTLVKTCIDEKEYKKLVELFLDSI